jgi:hypothetical protein
VKTYLEPGVCRKAVADSKGVNAEAEESTGLGTVIRQRLAKTQQTEKT